jgi:aldehyde:ferredoxin oxidoreductase
MAFGANCCNGDYPSILHANLLCNKYGLDVISTGCNIAFMMECYENGIITKKDVDGLDLSWGNSKSMISLIHKIANLKGIGELVAEGTYRMAKKFGKGADKYAMHVKKLEISGQDGRTHRSAGLTHAVSSRGADHLRALVTVDQLGYEDVAAKRWGKDKLPEICDPYSEEWKALTVKTCEDLYAVRDTLIVCWYSCGWPPIMYMDDFAKSLQLATGETAFTVKELWKIGERIVALERCFNAREGIRRRDDTLPRRFTKEPMPEGPGKGQVVDLDRMLNEYYDLRGYNKKTGLPTDETLKRLGLDKEANNLQELQRKER